MTNNALWASVLFQEIRGIAIFGLITLVIGVWVGYWMNGNFLHNQAIQNECAHYDSRTGEFKWGVAQ